MKTLILLSIFIFYVLSVWFCYRQARKYYKEISWKKPDDLDIAWLFTPIANIIMGLSLREERIMNKTNKTLTERFFRL